MFAAVPIELVIFDRNRLTKLGCKRASQRDCETRVCSHSMEEQLIHYSATPLPNVMSRDPGNTGTPHGLWVSVGDAWLRAQQRLHEEGQLVSHYPHAFKYANLITLRDDNTILVISHEVQFRRFNDQYSEPRPDWPLIPNPATRGIRWGEVAHNHQGILINPHFEQFSHRITKSGIHTPIPEFFWYYMWLVPSGCIWDASAVACIEPLKITLPPRSDMNG